MDPAQEPASGREWVLSWAGPSVHAVTGQMFPESPSVLGTELHAGLEPGAPLAFLGGRQPSPLLPRIVTPWQHQQGLWRQRAVEAEGCSRSGPCEAGYKWTRREETGQQHGCRKGGNQLGEPVGTCEILPFSATQVCCLASLGSCPRLTP